jgi:hypothetical protein
LALYIVGELGGGVSVNAARDLCVFNFSLDGDDITILALALQGNIQIPAALTQENEITLLSATSHYDHLISRLLPFSHKNKQQTRNPLALQNRPLYY